MTKGLAGAAFADHAADLGIVFVRPDRRDQTRRHGNLTPARQRIASIFDTWKGQLSLELHGDRTPAGVPLGPLNGSWPSPPRSGTTG